MNDPGGTREFTISDYARYQIVSVFVGFRSKETRRKGIFGFDREVKREPKKGGRGRKETLAEKPRDFENLRTQRLIGSASRTTLTCVDQRFVSYLEVMYGP